MTGRTMPSGAAGALSVTRSSTATGSCVSARRRTGSPCTVVNSEASSTDDAYCDACRRMRRPRTGTAWRPSELASASLPLSPGASILLRTGCTGSNLDTVSASLPGARSINRSTRVFVEEFGLASGHSRSSGARRPLSLRGRSGLCPLPSTVAAWAHGRRIRLVAAACRRTVRRQGRGSHRGGHHAGHPRRLPQPASRSNAPRKVPPRGPPPNPPRGGRRLPPRGGRAAISPRFVRGLRDAPPRPPPKRVGFQSRTVRPRSTSTRMRRPPMRIPSAREYAANVSHAPPKCTYFACRARGQTGQMRTPGCVQRGRAQSAHFLCVRSGQARAPSRAQWYRRAGAPQRAS